MFIGFSPPTFAWKRPHSIRSLRIPKVNLSALLSYLTGAEIRAGEERRRLPFSEFGRSLNGPDLFTDSPFLWSSLPRPSWTEGNALPSSSDKALFFTKFS